jgi:hyperosmotically inducible periplasmic protein
MNTKLKLLTGLLALSCLSAIAAEHGSNMNSKRPYDTSTTLSGHSKTTHPYSEKSTVATDKSNADNTSRNAMDKNRYNTPLNQGSSEADVATTQRIRKQIMATKGLSLNAQNVKIITNGGYVTLRGPVETLQEQQTIRKIANSVVGMKNVDNQIEVKFSSTN